MTDLSIIIPVYNVEKYLRKFIDCLKSQTIQNFVAVFVIDNSPDKSKELILEYKKELYDRVVILENSENIGLSATRNVGLEYVSEHPTKYVSFLDPDDWMDSDYLEDLYYSAEEYDLDLCISGIVRYNESDNKTICTEMVKMRKDVFDNPSECYELAFINPCAYAKLYRFEPVKDLRVRSIKRSEDTCYLFETLRVYKRIKFTNNAKYHYCVRDKSLTGLIDEETYESMHHVFADMLPLFDGMDGLRDAFITQIYIRSSLGGVCRLCFKDMKKASEIEKREREFLDTFLPEWKKNKYLSFGTIKSKNIKEIFLKFTVLMYRLHCFSLFIWLYYFVSQVLRKDIRA